MTSLAAVVFIALPAMLNMRKLKYAINQVDSADKTDDLKSQIIKGMKDGVGKGYRKFCGIGILVAIVGFMVTCLITWTIEPEAGPRLVLGWAGLSFMFYGIAYVTLLICTMYAFIVRYSARGVSNVVVELQKLHPESGYIMRVNSAINTGVAQDVMRIATVVAVVGASLSGAVMIAALFMASSYAIDCARSSKCL